MTHELYLTDGTTTINLYADNYLVFGWSPQNPVFNSGPQTVADIGNRENITEHISLRVHDAVDRPAVQTKIRAITELIAAAEHRHAHGNGPKVYLQLKLSGEADLWQSEILGGAHELAGSAYREWATRGANTTVELFRRFYWEMAVDQQLSITNSGGATSTTVGITNNHDANYVRIAADQIPGDIPTPLKIRMVNTASNMLGSHEIYISNNVFNAPAAFDGYLTDTDLDVGTAAQSWSSATHDLVNPRWAWDLPDTLLADCAGGWFKVLVGFSALSDNTYLKPSLYSTISGVNSLIYEGDEILSGDQPFTTHNLLDLGALPIPPGDMINATSVRLGITARDAAAGNATMNFVEIMPSTSFTSLLKPNHSWTVSSSITDNGTEGNAYSGPDSSRAPNIFKKGPPIYAWPNRANRVNFLYRFGSTFPSGNTMDVSVWCRPRRATV